MTIRSETGRASTLDVLDQLPVGVMLMDEDGNVVHQNAALHALWDGFVRAPGGDPFPAHAYTPSAIVLAPEDWPIRRSLSTGDTLRDVIIELERPDREPISVVVDSRPLLDEQGRRTGAVMIVRDVTEAHDEALLREALVGILSHELRTPVTSIYGGVELLRSHRLSADVSQDVLNDVAIEAETLHRLIDDLLVMIRLERGVQMAVPEPILVHRTVSLALADERRRWPGTSFVADIPSDLPAGRGDDGLIRQVLRNLLSNAAKYGPPGGTVTVRARPVPDGIELRVLDDGPGISDDQRDRVFGLFYRGTTTARIQGSGIGLYVARALMEAMGGTIEIGEPTRGAEFILRLPIYLEPSSDEAESPARSDVEGVMADPLPVATAGRGMVSFGRTGPAASLPWGRCSASWSS